MAYVLADRVWETSTSTGTGNMILGGAISTFRRFQDAISVDGGVTTFPYVIESNDANEFEVGISYLDTATQLKRGGVQIVLASSNSNNPVTFSSGTKNVFISTNTLWVTNLAKHSEVNNFTKQQYFGTATLTDGANISWNLDSAQVSKVTLGGNRTLDNPTNMKNGATYILHVIQDGTGSRTLTFGSAYKWPSDTPPTLSTTANSRDILTFVSDGTYMLGASQLGFTV